MNRISQNRLISEFGWSLKLIQKYLPFSDHELPNPQKPNYPMMKLYDQHRVERIMSDPEFRADQKKAIERSQKIKETKRKKKYS